MSGGKGGVLNTVIAVLSLEMLYTGTILFGWGNEVKIFISGLILASVVLYEAYAAYKHERTVGATHRAAQGARQQRMTLRTVGRSIEPKAIERRLEMKKKVRMMGVALVLLLVGAMMFAQGAGETGGSTADAAANLEASLAVDSSVLKAADGQPLLRLATEDPVVPKRPADPAASA